MKKRGKIILIAAAVYVLLLVLLVAAESGKAEASIHSFWDAVWFSLITMTTVGYGDLSPVTLPGRIIGLIFAFCSIGVLSAMVGLCLGLVSGRMMPKLRLRLNRNRSWIVFNEENEDAVTLAKEYIRTEPGSLLIFPRRGEKKLWERSIVRIDTDPEELLRLRKSGPKGIRSFYLAADGWRNAREARQAAGQGITSFCMSDEVTDALPDGLHQFSRNELLSRCYWKEHPLRTEENCVVIIGCETSGNALLERALLTNVFDAGRTVEYHVFGADGTFEKQHPLLVGDLSENGTDGDNLRFYPDSWEAHSDLLQGADRILICSDDDKTNLSVYSSLLSWFPTAASIHVRLSLRDPQIPSFGCSEEIITREFVERDAVNERAQTMHRIYSMGISEPVPWEKLSEFLRQSNIAAADHVPVKVRYLLEDDSLTDPDPETLGKAFDRYRKMSGEQREPLLELEHRRWLRFYRLYNWEYDKVRNDSLRRHPMIRPYAKLGRKEQQKDAYAWDILGRLTEEE